MASRILRHLVEPPRVCPYLCDQLATLEHKLMVDVTPDELDVLLERGWRRFGPDYFRPVCASCMACRPTRLPAAQFSATRSQRRAIRVSRGLRVVVGQPSVDAERLSLYHAWHAERERVRHWEPSDLGPREYTLEFAFPHSCAREVAYYDDARGGRLVAVGLCDETKRAWSLAYCFYDPDDGARSLGTVNIVTGIRLAQERGLSYVYLGYAVEGCPSLRYKSHFGPREELVGRPELDDGPNWVRPRDGA